MVYLRTFLYFCFFAFAGCTSNTYVYGTGKYGESSGSPKLENKVYVGAPNKFLDSSDWFWPISLLGKLFLWNRKVDSHEVSEKTIDELIVYLERNELTDVQVLVNTYKPGLQWRRLGKNKEVGAGWRYTLGALSVIVYTILPGRFFGGDHYNPYTNTISIYSDDPNIALHEGGHAKDFNSRKRIGLNAAIYVIPGAALYYEANATRDALSYLRDNCRPDDEKEAYKTLHPAYGTYVGGLTPFGLIAAIPGHVTGAVASANVKESPDCEQTFTADNHQLVNPDAQEMHNTTLTPELIDETDTDIQNDADGPYDDKADSI